MVTQVTTTGNLANFTRNYSEWARKVLPQERKCLNQKISKRGLDGVTAKARRLGYRKPERYLKLTRNRQGFTLSIDPVDRTGQILRLAALGRTVRLPNRELGHAMIVKDRRFSRAGVFRTLREVYNERVERSGNGKRIYYGRRGLMVLVTRRAVTLTRRNRGGRLGLIAVLPKRVRYKRRIDIDQEVRIAIERNLQKDAEECLRKNTFRKLAQFF